MVDRALLFMTFLQSSSAEARSRIRTLRSRGGSANHLRTSIPLASVFSYVHDWQQWRKLAEIPALGAAKKNVKKSVIPTSCDLRDEIPEQSPHLVVDPQG